MLVKKFCEIGQKLHLKKKEYVNVTIETFPYKLVNVVNRAYLYTNGEPIVYPK